MATGDPSDAEQTDDRHRFREVPTHEISLSLSCDIILLEMKGTGFKKRSTLSGRCLPSRTILRAVLELGVRVLESQWQPQYSHMGLKKMA